MLLARKMSKPMKVTTNILVHRDIKTHEILNRIIMGENTVFAPFFVHFNSNRGPVKVLNFLFFFFLNSRSSSIF